jgi:predicted metal-dependent hydrolase
MERQDFIKDGYNYEYYLIRKSIKNVRMTVDSDMKIIVSAPTYVSKRKIESFIHQNKAFIDKNISKRQGVLEHHNIKEFKTGEYFLLLGEKTRIVSKKFFENKVFIEDDALFILLEENTFEERKKQFERFIKNTAKKLFNEMLDEKYPYFSDKIKQKPKITIRKMKTKWGSTNPSKNKITLNTTLLYAPKNLIEYVIIHELCHFYHLNHSKEYYNFLYKVMPDFKERRKALRSKYGFLI